MAGGTAAENIARWDGADWSALGAGVDHAVYAIDAFAGDLFAGGSFSTAGGVSAPRIARWDGSTWSAAGGWPDTWVDDLFSFDNGTGPALYAGGTFSTVDGVPASRIARWTGVEWQALEGPVGNGLTGYSVIAMAGGGIGETSLFVAGQYILAAGGRASANLARWSCNGIFGDGFESGGTNAWSNTVP